MSIGLLSILIVVVLFSMLTAGVPFAFAAGSIGVVIAWAKFGPDSLFIISSRTYDLVTEFTMIAIPMFVLMAAILERSGVARDLYNTLQVWVGRGRAGVALVTLAIAFILGATTGIVGGEVVLLGLVALPQMLRLGYDKRLALGTICAGGSLGTMVPPSIVLIFYGINVGVSIGDLFKATAVPALLMVLLYAGYVYLRCVFNPSLAPVAPPDSLGEPPRLGAALKNVGLPVFVILSVLGSIYLGIASITESAACGVAGVLIATAVRGELEWKLVRDALAQTVLTCGVVLWLVFGTNALIGVYNAIGGISFAQQLLGGVATDKWALLAISLSVILVLGFFIDWVGILFLTMPVFVPLLKTAGVDLIWFGVLFNIAVQIAYLTPPFAPSAFYLKSVAPPEIKLADIYAGSWPFIGLQLLALALVMAFPDFALWLPRVTG